VLLAPNTHNTKFAKAQQAQVTNNFKNIKEKLLKTNAAIWFNKICKNHQPAPKYIKNQSKWQQQSYDTIKLAIKYRLSQELKFLYMQEQKVNEKLYRTRLECAIQWNTLWDCIQTSIENKLQYVTEAVYDKWNKKLDDLRHNKNISMLHHKTTFLNVSTIELIHLSIKRNSKSRTSASIIAVKPTNRFIRNILCMEVTNI
jgi:hypothetical protein